MDTRLLYSLVIIGIVSAAAGAGTFAFFNDTETSTNNTFTSGVIDVDVDGQNPWNKTYTINDMKPSYRKWLNFTVHNNGTNPAYIWKHINVTDQVNGAETEPELDADPTGTVNDLENVTTFDLQLRLEEGPDVYIITDAEGVKVGNVSSYWIPLDADPTTPEMDPLMPSQNLHVGQSFHMDSDAGNEYQGDKMTFDEEILATQVNAPEPTPVWVLND